MPAPINEYYDLQIKSFSQSELTVNFTTLGESTKFTLVIESATMSALFSAHDLPVGKDVQLDVSSARLSPGAQYSIYVHGNYDDYSGEIVPATIPTSQPVTPTDTAEGNVTIVASVVSVVNGTATVLIQLPGDQGIATLFDIVIVGGLQQTQHTTIAPGSEKTVTVDAPPGSKTTVQIYATADPQTVATVSFEVPPKTPTPAPPPVDLSLAIFPLSDTSAKLTWNNTYCTGYGVAVNGKFIQRIPSTGINVSSLQSGDIITVSDACGNTASVTFLPATTGGSGGATAGTGGTGALGWISATHTLAGVTLPGYGWIAGALGLGWLLRRK